MRKMCATFPSIDHLTFNQSFRRSYRSLFVARLGVLEVQELNIDNSPDRFCIVASIDSQKVDWTTHKTLWCDSFAIIVFRYVETKN